ncbi:hypothetical protein PGAL8A_00265600 [Plasmodium gallinaceum]|uniref:Plasmodium RESA N-terminal domain-containing protein n=1 Tax=Plasmodium gallinaceum TaxID=5849 RepID=A0A1J1GWR1_PLAGA|nr:hypothetical protein PGAL8A_00265600 [Plasmodium gallinaceum]CRG95453.1 hypothetical protein PGAL8A_00265600 [Plasmodium gallinaceum]
MNISKLFYFFIYLIVVNIEVPCLSMQADAPFKGDSSNLESNNDTNTEVNSENEAPYTVINDLEKYINDIVLKGFNNSSPNKKKDLLKHREGLKNVIHEIIKRKHKISINQRDYIVTKAIYELLKGSLEFMEDIDQEKKDIKNRCFWMKEYHDSVRNSEWHDLIKIMKDEFTIRETPEDLTNNEKEELWEMWYSNLMKRKMEDELTQTTWFINMMDQQETESSFKTFFDSSSLSWNSYKSYLISEMNKFLTRETMKRSKMS